MINTYNMSVVCRKVLCQHLILTTELACTHICQTSHHLTLIHAFC